LPGKAELIFTTDHTDDTDVRGAHAGSRVGSGGSPKQSFFTEGNEGNEGLGRTESLFSLLSSV
jgi:hypothetical protein